MRLCGMHVVVFIQQTRLITMEIFQTCFIVIIQLICSCVHLFAPFSFYRHAVSLSFAVVMMPLDDEPVAAFNEIYNSFFVQQFNSIALGF